jgi:hypothetical protein
MSLPIYLNTPIAARLARVTETKLTELVRADRIRKFGAKHGHFLADDIARLRGSPIDDAELAFVEHQHQKRLASYRKQNEKRAQHATA